MAAQDKSDGGRPEDRRQFVRLPSWLNADYKVVGARSKSRFYSLTRNTGAGGVGFFTESQLPQGTVVEVRVKFPNRPRAISFTAEVIWSGKLLLDSTKERLPRVFETGLRFLEIAIEDRNFMMDFSGTPPPPVPPAT